jgi:hypothetical protein
MIGCLLNKLIIFLIVAVVVVGLFIALAPWIALIGVVSHF